MLRDLQIAANDPLAENVGSVVGGISGRGRFRGREDVASIHFQARSSCETIVEFTTPFAFPPKDDDI